MAFFRTVTSKGKDYLQYVHSYRDKKGQSLKKVLASLGNISDKSEEDIEKMAKSFLRALGMEDKFQMNKFTTGKGYHYGLCLPVIGVWNQLGLDRIIGRYLSSKVKIPVSRISLIQVANRFSSPSSKLACYRWYDRSLFSQMKNFIHFPDDKKEKVHTYYRSLDYLYSIKEKMEEELYYRLKGYGLDNSLVLYDITSIFFEGNEAEGAKYGHSRDHRSDAKQVVVGIVMSKDGLPISHYVFEGNCADKSTVKEVIEDLETRFSLREIVFVGDRGMMTFENIEFIKSKDKDYIMGLQKRNRRLVKYLIEEVLSAKYHDRNQSALAIQEFGYDDLSLELQNEYSEEVRFIACYNSDVARKNKITRERNIKKFEKLFEEKKKKGVLSEVKEVYHQLKSFLSKYHMTKFYDIKLSKIEVDDAVKEDNEENYQILIYRNADAIEFEEQIDGRYFLQTEVGKSKLSKELVERYYKSLQKVERSFRILKNEFDIRPVNVRKGTRIHGHIMICYLALLIETLIERKINEMYPNDTDRKKQKAMLIGEENGLLNTRILKEELETVILVPLYFGKGKKPKYISTSIPNNIRKLLSSLGIKNALDPEKLYYSKKGMRDYNGQLEIAF